MFTRQKFISNPDVLVLLINLCLHTLGLSLTLGPADHNMLVVFELKMCLAFLNVFRQHSAFLSLI